MIYKIKTALTYFVYGHSHCGKYSRGWDLIVFKNNKLYLKN